MTSLRGAAPLANERRARRCADLWRSEEGWSEASLGGSTGRKFRGEGVGLKPASATDREVPNRTDVTLRCTFREGGSASVTPYGASDGSGGIA